MSIINSSERIKSNYTISSFNGWGLTAFDSLDTMLIMGLEDEYQKGLTVVRQANFSVSKVRFPPSPATQSPKFAFTSPKMDMCNSLRQSFVISEDYFLPMHSRLMIPFSLNVQLILSESLTRSLIVQVA